MKSKSTLQDLLDGLKRAQEYRLDETEKERKTEATLSSAKRSNVVSFPADRIARGLHLYTPEMNQRKPNCQIKARLSHYGNHYYLDTTLDLKGRGITLEKVYTSNDLTPFAQYMVGWRHYKVTVATFEKLKEIYSISIENQLD